MTSKIDQALEPAEQERALAAYSLLNSDRNMAIIRTALEMRRDEFATQAEASRLAYEAGESNGLITNNGFGQMAVMFTEQVAATQTLLESLRSWEEDETA